MTDLTPLSDAAILAMTAYGENRGGGSVGMQSVINVIMNRAAHPSWWGSKPRDCCLKPEQFDCWNTDDPNFDTITSVDPADPVYASALQMANEALVGTLPDITSNATYYYAVSMPQKPYWAKGHTPCAVIAGQAFFNDIN